MCHADCILFSLFSPFLSFEMTSMLISDQKRDKVDNNVLALQWAAFTGNIGIFTVVYDLVYFINVLKGL